MQDGERLSLNVEPHFDKLFRNSALHNKLICLFSEREHPQEVVEASQYPALQCLGVDREEAEGSLERVPHPLLAQVGRVLG